MSRRQGHYVRRDPSDLDQLSRVEDGLRLNSSVVLYAPFTGANNAVTARDYSRGNHSLTFNGGAKISTAQSYYNGGSALYLDGNGDYVEVSNGGTDFNLGAGDFTLKQKAYFTDLSSRKGLWSVHNNSNLQCESYYVHDSSQGIRINFTNSGGAYVIACYSPLVLSVNTWYDIMWTRKNGLMAFYVNGIFYPLIFAYGTGSEEFPAYTANMKIGYAELDAAYMQGYLSDLMIIKGEAWSVHKFYDATLDAKSSYLKAAWKFGDYGVTDVIGANTLTNNGTVTFADVGLQGQKCATFNGSSQYFTKSSFSEGTFGDCSIAFWMFISPTSHGLQGIFRLHTISPAFYMVEVKLDGYAGNQINAEIYDQINNPIVRGPTLSLSTWYHICLTVSNGGDVKLYVNAGTPTVETNTADGSKYGIVSDVTVGYRGAAQYFHGSIMEFLLYNTALTPTEISLLYNSGKAKLLQLERREHKRYFNDAYLDSYSKFLVADWKLDEMSGTRYDSAGFNHLTDNGGVTYTDDAVHGRVATFNSSTHLSTATCPDTVAFSALTVCAWVKLNSVTAPIAICAQAQGAVADNQCWWLYGWTPHQFNFGLHTSATAWGAGSNAMFNDAGFTYTGNWIHIVGTWDGTTVALYINGSAAGTNGAATGTLLPVVPVDIGYQSWYGNSFDGNISDIKIYKGIALDSTAISRLYNEGAGRKADQARLADSTISGVVPFDCLRNTQGPL